MSSSLAINATPRTLADSYISASVNSFAEVFDVDAAAALLLLARAIERQQAILDRASHTEMQMQQLQAARSIVANPADHPDEDLRAAARIIQARDIDPARITEATDIIDLMDAQ